MSETAPARDNGKSEPGVAPPRPEPDALPFTPAAQADGAEAAEEADSTRPIGAAGGSAASPQREAVGGGVRKALQVASYT